MKIKNILKMTCLSFLIIACEDEDTIRVPDFGTGANVRIQLNQELTNLNFDDIQNASIEYSVFSENTDIESIVLTVVYNNAATATATDPIAFKTYTQASFSNGEIRNERVTSSELASLIGLNGPGDFNGGDFLVFSNVTTLTDGQVFPSETIGGNLNVPPGIVNSAATQIFSVGWTSFVACPLPFNFDGNYRVVATSGCADGFAPDVTDDPNDIETVSLTQVNGPIYNLSGFTSFGFDGRNVDILFICGQVLIINKSPQLGCGGTSVVYNTAVSGAGTYDTAAEEFTFTLIYDSVTTCGGPFQDCSNEFVIKVD
jgi:hypothetical protein